MLPSIEELNEHIDFDVNHLIIVAIIEGDFFTVEHICAYESKPTIEVVEDLKRELSEDEEFGIDPEVLAKCTFGVFNKDEYIEFITILDKQGETNE